MYPIKPHKTLSFCADNSNLAPARDSWKCVCPLMIATKKKLKMGSYHIIVKDMRFHGGTIFYAADTSLIYLVCLSHCYASYVHR